MQLSRILKIGLPIALVAAGVLASDGWFSFTPVPFANHKVVGTAYPNVLPPELTETIVAQGSNKLENPVAGVAGHYGYDDDGPLVPVPGDLPVTGHKVEATKTEPDKNTYLILRNQHGADATYDYGTHFLYQGHELGKGYITRINLDADGDHRVTLLATQDTTPSPLPVFDGSTWYPFSHHLLFSQEGNGSTTGGIWQATPDFPSTVESLTGVMGRGGYEGMQASEVNHFPELFIVEDIGGAVGSAAAVLNHAKQPNSFIYRFVPYIANDLKAGGILYALQVNSLAHPGPIVFTQPAITPPATVPTAAQIATAADADIKSQDVKDLHTYGKTFTTTWVKVHDTSTDGFAPFNANALAKAKGGTPFKRPENGQFRPGKNFREFIFDETGDTDNRTEAGTTYGGFGAIFRLTLDASGSTGNLSLVYNGDLDHSGFDNCSFWDEHRIVFVEDAGDTLHTQRNAIGVGNALDSAWMFDLNVDYSNLSNKPKRVLAEGRDASATLDSQFSALTPVAPATSTGYQNEGDNELTGWHQSDGDPGVDGLLGAKIPTPFRNGWRLFYTQQHGDNFTFEILPSNWFHFDRDDDDHGRGHDDDRDRR